MGDVVNLQQYRKKLKRERAAARASGSRARHGLSRHERRGIEIERRRLDKELDEKRLERRDGDEKPPKA